MAQVELMAAQKDLALMQGKLTLASNEAWTYRAMVRDLESQLSATQGQITDSWGLNRTTGQRDGGA